MWFHNAQTKHSYECHNNYWNVTNNQLSLIMANMIMSLKAALCVSRFNNMKLYWKILMYLLLSMTECISLVYTGMFVYTVVVNNWIWSHSPNEKYSLMNKES